jgi:hypothetical protein
MFYVFLLIVGVAGVAIYLLFILREVPGAADERLGRLEDLPPDLGKWRKDEDSPEARAAVLRGELREVRFFYDRTRGGFRGGRLLRQVRYRSLETKEILRADADEFIKRKRVRSPGVPERVSYKNNGGSS